MKSSLCWRKTGCSKRPCITISCIDLDKKNAVGDTPLLLAAKLGYRKAVGFLIKYGANEEIEDNCGRNLSYYKEKWVMEKKETL